MSDHERKITETGNPPGGFDSELDVPNIVRTGVGLGAITIVAVIGMWFLMNWLADRLEDRPQETTPLVAEGLELPPPEPRLEPDPDRAFDALWAADHAALNSYGWVDKQAGIAHIPIEAAIDLVVDDLGKD